ncbi:acyl-CoA dehydrogenase family protein [Hyphomonas pacifica]|uniref:Uncharacterized protein n=1 Tax=Hyphomonas pacifica TaxID=1280941 RepID=A0A062U121_9PROT|nr:acyl-CoA dehydrogenase family protein [Hyphomonas pacifica]KCZ50319.1 hypothetical protein HY2_14315 [Hyphomonas pacifica]RAN32592.1 hypothetical protein HY3_14795 [Hyphomonas pacifica]
MEFGLSEDQTLLQETVRRFVAEQAPLDLIRKIAEGNADAKQTITTGMDELGLNGVVIPEELGGAGLGMLDAVLVQECLGYGIVPSGFLANVVASSTLSRVDTGLVQDIAAGEARFGIALNDLVSRRDGAGLSAESGELSGTSMMALSAEDATHLLVCDGEGKLHVCAPQDHQILLTIDRTRVFAELKLSKAKSHVSVTDGKGALARACLLLAADSLGVSQAMLDKAVEYAKERKQFGRVIGSFQAVKHLCAEMAAKIEPCRAFIWHAAHALDMDEDEASVMAFLAKAHMSDVATFVARTSTEVHGGMGFTDLVGLHYWFKRVGVNRQLLGSPAQLRQMAAVAQGLVAA